MTSGQNIWTESYGESPALVSRTLWPASQSTSAGLPSAECRTVTNFPCLEHHISHFVFVMMKTMMTMMMAMMKAMMTTTATTTTMTVMTMMMMKSADSC